MSPLEVSKQIQGPRTTLALLCPAAIPRSKARKANHSSSARPDPGEEVPSTQLCGPQLPQELFPGLQEPCSPSPLGGLAGDASSAQLPDAFSEAQQSLGKPTLAGL